MLKILAGSPRPEVCLQPLAHAAILSRASPCSSRLSQQQHLTLCKGAAKKKRPDDHSWLAYSSNLQVQLGQPRTSSELSVTSKLIPLSSLCPYPAYHLLDAPKTYYFYCGPYVGVLGAGKSSLAPATAMCPSDDG